MDMLVGQSVCHYAMINFVKSVNTARDYVVAIEERFSGAGERIGELVHSYSPVTQL